MLRVIGEISSSKFFGVEELTYVKQNIIGIGHKDLIADLQSGDICLGIKKHHHQSQQQDATVSDQEKTEDNDDEATKDEL